MTIDELADIIRKHRFLTLRVLDQKSYKIGNNASIFQAEPKPDPDNRISVPFIRRMVKLVKGYFAKVGNITYTDDGWFDGGMSQIYDNNNEELKTSEIFEDAITYGSGFELHWYDKEKGFRFAIIPIDQCIPVYSDDIEPVMTGFVWLRKNRDGNDVATYYDDKSYTEYIKPPGTGEKDWKVNKDNTGFHVYNGVPVLEANVDRDKKNLFDSCLPLIDFYDKLISEVGNEHEKFAESILLLRNLIDDINEDEDGKTELDKLAEYRVLDSLGENVRDAAAYLERNVNDQFINNTLDRFERLIYEMLCLFNPNDDSFATASGIAQLYKLFGFELMIADIESYFSEFLQARIKLIAGHALSKMDKKGADNVTINFKRNLPADIEKIITLATMASGGKQVLPMETILNMFPSTLVPDKEKVLKLLEEQKPTIQDPMQNEEPNIDDQVIDEGI